MGFWVTKAATSPRRSMASKITCPVKGNLGHWSAKIKNRIAGQLEYIRHWKIKEACYTTLKNEEATCNERKGQVIVCENNQADWLPFKKFWETKGMKKNTTEVMWTNEQ